jgi:hypothetical protein
MQFCNHQLASGPGDNAGHPFDLNDPQEEEEEEEQQILHAGDYLSHVQVMFATIIVNVKKIHNLL